MGHIEQDNGHPVQQILRFHFTDRVSVANKENWCNVTSLIRASAQDAYYRDLSLDKRIRFVHDFLLARVWYIAQIFPLTSDSMRQINTTITWFIWHGEIFRVALSTLQRERYTGGWDLVNIWAKSRALFIYSLQAQGRHERSFMGASLKSWNIHTGADNPPYLNLIPTMLGYLREYMTAVAYIRHRDNTESDTAYKKRLYTSLKELFHVHNAQQMMQITRLWPNAGWESIWRNLQVAPVSRLYKATWYKVIHDIFPTNVRLHRIKMSPTDTCKDCSCKDSIGHHLTKCVEGPTTWGWTKIIIVRILHTTTANIPDEWLVCPQISLWPPQCHRAVL